MENMKDLFKQHFFKELTVELNQNYSTHTPVEKMIEIVFEASRKAGMDSYSVLKDFQFTEEEIKNYFERKKGGNSNLN